MIAAVDCPRPDELLQLVHGSDDDAVHEHIDRCDACRRALAEATRAHFTDRPAQPDRYVVIDVLGAGASGVVYTAFDTKLDRKVALKLVHHAGEREQWAARFVREAKLLARLSHPNVVAVHDVGTLDDQVYIAMELVEGASLARWLAERPSWREIVAVFAGAARGLQAAHDAGIVHRDFKPENVLLGADRRPRVADFGLADDDDTSDAIVGTPAYVAPEQLAGKPVDGRADQFSFCVALYEALYRELPFRAKELRTRAAEIAHGSIRPAPESADVPAWLRAAVLRGLAPAPADRYPSMAALASALLDDPRGRRRRRVALAAVGVLGVAAAATVWWTLARPAGVSPCGGSEQAVASAWNAERRLAITRAFAATGKPFATDVGRTTVAALDDYAERWAVMHRDACEATRVRGEQSDELLDLRMGCLAARLDELRAFVDVLARGDTAVLARAATGAGTLTRIDDCASSAALRARMAPPRDAISRARVDSIRARLASARALTAAGRYADAMPIALACVREARELGYRPVEAEAQLAASKLQVETGDLATAEKTLLDATVAAEAGHHDEVLAQAMGAATFVVGYGMARYGEGQAWARQALAIVERLGGDDALAGHILDNLGAMQFRQGHYDDAIATDREALRHLERAYGTDHLEIANALNNLGAPLEAAGRYTDALAQFRRALAIDEAKLGARHPDVALERSNIGTVLRDLGQLEDAAAELERALAIKEAAFGAEHASLAPSLENLASTLRDEHEYDRALALLGRALAIRSKAGNRLELVLVHRNIADVLAAAGRFDAAFAEYRTVIADETALLGADHPKLIETRLNHAEAQLRANRTRHALAGYTATLAALEGKPALARYVPYAALGVGECELALHAWRSAVAPLESALAAWQRVPGNAIEIERARIALARARREAGDRSRSLESVR